MTVSTSELEMLRNLTDVGASQAAKALGVLLGGKVSQAGAEACYQTAEQLAAQCGGMHAQVTTVWFSVDADIAGSMLVVLTRDDARSLAERLVRLPVEQAFSLMQLSALQETSNILVSACLSGWANALKMKILPSVPFFLEDEAGHVMQEIFSRNPKREDTTLVLHSRLMAEGNSPLSLQLFWMPDSASQAKLGEALRMSRKG